MIGKFGTRLKFAAAVVLACGAATIAAQPVTFIVPFAPGGTTDILARVLGQKMSEAMGTPVIIDNRPGSGGMVGLEMAVRASGATPILGMLTTSTLFASLGSKPGLVQEFQMVSLLAISGRVIVSNRDATIADLVKRSKQGQQVRFGSAGTGGVDHICFEQFLKRTGRQGQGVDIEYRGTAPLLVALLDGGVEAACLDIAAALPYIKSGKLRALAVTLPHPHDQLPGIPTLESAGVQGVISGAVSAVVTPKGTSRATLNSMVAGLKRAVSDPEVRNRLAESNVDLVSANEVGPEIAEAFIQREVAELSPYVYLLTGTAQFAGSGGPSVVPSSASANLAQASGARPPTEITVPAQGGSSAPGSPDFQPTRPSPSAISGSGAAGAACVAAIDRQEAEFRPISQRIANTQSVVSQSKLLMDMLTKRMALLDQFCKGQPQYAEYAGTKQQYDSTMRNCLGLASNPGDCGSQQAPVRTQQQTPDCSLPYSAVKDLNGKCIGSPVCCSALTSGAGNPQIDDSCRFDAHGAYVSGKTRAECVGNASPPTPPPTGRGNTIQ